MKNVRRVLFVLLAQLQIVGREEVGLGFGDKLVLSCFFDLKTNSVADHVLKRTKKYKFVEIRLNSYNSIAKCHKPAAHSRWQKKKLD
jgi:hypothetical protein